MRDEGKEKKEEIKMIDKEQVKEGNGKEEEIKMRDE